MATPLSSAIVALMAEYTGREAPRSRCFEEESVKVCMHDNPTTGELSLVTDGKDEAVLAIRRTCQDSMRADLIAISERLTARKVAALMSAARSNPDVATSRSCSNSTARRPTIKKAHPDRRLIDSADLLSGERIGESKRGLVICRDHEAPPVARGEAPVAAGAVEPTERTPPSAGCDRRGRGACPNEPGQPLPPRLVRFAQRTGAPISAAHTARVLGRWGGSGSTVVRHACLSVRLRSGTARGSA